MRPHHHISLDYELKLDDWVAAVMHATDKSGFATAMTNQLNNLSFEAAVFVFLALPVIVLLGGAPILIFMLLPLLFAVGFWLYRRPLKTAKDIHQKLQSSLPEEYVGQVQLTATAKFLQTSTSQSDNTYDWQDVSSVEENGFYIFLSIGADNFWVIPARAFENETAFVNAAWRLKKFRSDADGAYDSPTTSREKH